VVQELIGSGNDYKVQELTESSGGLCGGTFLDESFMPGDNDCVCLLAFAPWRFSSQIDI
jgi:hypothetical protein